jgi:hypothetical protein
VEGTSVHVEAEEPVNGCDSTDTATTCTGTIQTVQGDVLHPHDDLIDGSGLTGVSLDVSAGPGETSSWAARPTTP